MRRLVYALVVLLAGCRPKGSDKAPTIEKTSSGNFVIRHPNFEGHLDPKVVRDKSTFVLKLEYSSFPEKSSITIEGKTIALTRSGDIPTSFDLGKELGDAPVKTLTGGGPDLPVTLPFELSFWDKRQKVSSSVTGVRAWLELRSCMQSPPCVFPNENPPSPIPNIAIFEQGDTMTTNIVGSPIRVRDVDWIAHSSAGDPIDGKKCKMSRLSRTTGLAEPYGDEHALKRETERITIYDRRSGAKLHTKEVVGPDACPLFADIAMTGDRAGLRSPVHRLDRDAIFKELRGEPPPAGASSTAQVPSQKPQKPRKK